MKTAVIIATQLIFAVALRFVCNSGAASLPGKGGQEATPALAIILPPSQHCLPLEGLCLVAALV